MLVQIFTLHFKIRTMEKYTYLIIDFVSVLFPFLLSFDKKVAFYKTWNRLFPAIFIVGVFFVVWDIAFTNLQVWSFNAKYIVGIKFFNLPIEEYLFFLCVPYSCVFIYDCYNAYFPQINPIKKPLQLALILSVLLLIVAAVNHNKYYTFYNCFFASALLLMQVFIFKGAYMGRFFVSYMIVLIPFLIVNGLLTALPVVEYNNTENLGIRIFTIPVEDTMYGMLNMLGVVTIMEQMKNKNHSIKSIHG